jgi:hypothetical protein
MKVLSYYLRSDHAGEWGAVKIYEGVEMAAGYASREY